MNRKISKSNIYLFISIVFLQFTSCKENAEEKTTYVNFGKTNIVFPDTLIINKDYKGFILYESLFDTLNLKKGENRFINLYIKGDTKMIEYSKANKIVYDTFGMYQDTIRFKIKFNKVGENYLNGYIGDDVYIESKDSMRIINKIVPITKKIFVKSR